MTATRTITGIEDGKIIIDAYSGEAMDPTFAHVWRDFCLARAYVEDVAKAIEGTAAEWDVPDLDDDAPFVWRDLTPEESAWSDRQYTERSPWGEIR